MRDAQAKSPLWASAMTIRAASAAVAFVFRIVARASESGGMETRTLPPAKMVWVSASGVETMGLICGDCDCVDEGELKTKIAAVVRGETPAMAAAAE